MKLKETQTLSLLSRFHIPLASYFPLRSEAEVEPLLEKHELSKGVVQEENKEEKICLTQEELRSALHEAFSCPRNDSVLIRPFLTVEYEIYISVVLEKETQEHVVMVAKGRKKERDQTECGSSLFLVKEPILKNKTLYPFQKEALFDALELSENMRVPFFQIIDKMLALYFSYDAISIEFNPIAVTYPVKMLVTRATLYVDDYALFRHPELRYFFEQNTLQTKGETLRKMGMLYGTMGGSIGVLTAGRELLFALIDLVQKNKGQVGGFVALSEETMEEHLFTGIKVLLEDPIHDVLFVNIFHGMKSLEGIRKVFLLASKTVLPRKIPIVLRMEIVDMRGIKELISSIDWPITLESQLDKAVAYAIDQVKRK